MKFLTTLAASSLWLSLLIGCTTSSEVSIPELPPGSPANPQSSTRSQMVAVPDLRADAITRATTSRLERKTPALPEMSVPMDHGSMKMDHATMNMKMDMAPEKMNHSPASPAAEIYTCTMHPEIHKPAPGDCPICGMKLVKEKPPTHAH